VLDTITNPYSEVHKQLSSLFREDVETLEKVYLTVKEGNTNDDHDSITLSKILDFDPDFIVEYVKWIYTPRKEGSRWLHDNQNYSALWRHQNYHEIFTRIIDLVYNKERVAHWYTKLRQFFMAEPEYRLDADTAEARRIAYRID
jgi:sensor histidine kinase YesM